MSHLPVQAGEDQFQRLLASIVSKAIASLDLHRAGAAQGGPGAVGGRGDPDGGAAGGARGAGGAAGLMEARLLSTQHFLESVGKLGGFKKVCGFQGGWGGRQVCEVWGGPGTSRADSTTHSFTIRICW